MRLLPFPLLVLFGTAADASFSRQDLPSCHVAEQRALAAPTGGSVSDPRQAHVQARANILQADIGTARKARRMSGRKADRLWQRVDAVRAESDRLTAEQGFLSAAERASYDRALDSVAQRLCR